MEHNSEVDRRLISDFLKWYIPLSPARKKSVVARRGEVGTRSLYRAIEANPSVEPGTFAGIARGMGLPVSTLIYIGSHDLEGLRDDGAPREVIRWVEERVKEESSRGQAANG